MVISANNVGRVVKPNFSEDKRVDYNTNIFDKLGSFVGLLNQLTSTGFYSTGFYNE